MSARRGRKRSNTNVPDDKSTTPLSIKEMLSSMAREVTTPQKTFEVIIYK
jgi:hypothetical protein